MTTPSTPFDGHLLRFKIAFATPDNRAERLRAAIGLRAASKCEDPRAELAFTLATMAIRYVNGDPGAEKAFSEAYAALAVFEEMSDEAQDLVDGWEPLGTITRDGWKPAT